MRLRTRTLKKAERQVFFIFMAGVLNWGFGRGRVTITGLPACESPVHSFRHDECTTSLNASRDSGERRQLATVHTRQYCARNVIAPTATDGSAHAAVGSPVHLGHLASDDISLETPAADPRCCAFSLIRNDQVVTRFGSDHRCPS